MSFWSNLFKSESKSESLDSAELGIMLNDRLNASREATFKESKGIINGIIKSVSVIESVVRGIEDAGIPDEMPVKLKRIVKTSKPSFVVGVLDSISPFLNKEVSDYDDLEELHKDLRRCLDSLAKSHVGQGRYLPIAFEGEFKTLKKESKHLLTLSDSLGKIVKRSAEEDELLLDTIGLFDEVNSSFARRDSLNSMLREGEKRLSSLRDKRERILGRIDSLSDSEESRDLSGLEKDLEDVEKKISELEGQIFHLLTPLKRPFKKYRKQAFELDKKTEELIDRLIEDPVEVFFSVEPKLVVALVDRLDKYVSEDRIKLKDKERDKVLDKIDLILESDLVSVGEEYSSLCGRRDKLVKSVERSAVLMKREKFESDLSGLDGDISLLENELSSFEDKIAVLEGNLGKLQAKVEANVSEIEGREITIVWD